MYAGNSVGGRDIGGWPALLLPVAVDGPMSFPPQLLLDKFLHGLAADAAGLSEPPVSV
jgi:hypothetical protein